MSNLSGYLAQNTSLKSAASGSGGCYNIRIGDCFAVGIRVRCVLITWLIIEGGVMCSLTDLTDSYPPTPSNLLSSTGAVGAHVSFCEGSVPLM